METIQSKLTDWRLRIIAAFQASPGKAWMLTILSTVFVVMVGRMLFKGSPVAPASAAHAPAAPARPADDWRPYSSTSPSVPLAQWARQPVQPLGRNLFSIPMDYFPYADGHTPGDGNDASANAQSLQADAQREHQVLVDNLRTQATNLKLQGVVLGASPGAWVNGTLYEPNQLIGTSGFRLVRIMPGKIVIESQGVLLAIQMK